MFNEHKRRPSNSKVSFLNFQKSPPHVVRRGNQKPRPRQPGFWTYLTKN